MLRQIEQVFRTTFKRDAEVGGERFHFTAAPTGNDHPRDAARHGQLALHPVGSHESSDVNAQHRDFVLEPRANGQRRENRAQRRFGEATGHEKNAFGGHEGLSP